MVRQRVFTKDFIDYLKRNIKVDNYKGESFPFDDTTTFPYNREKVIEIDNIEQPEGLLEKVLGYINDLDFDDETEKDQADYKTAIAIYEAYSNISPSFARKEDLWAYLTHVDLFNYVKKRWPEIETGGQSHSPEKYIKNHWFQHSSHFMRTTFAGLWWNVYLTVDNDRDDIYELTKLMFRLGKDWRMMRFGELTYIRNKESMIGILEFIRDHHEELTNDGKFTPRGQFISRYLNLMGATKQMAALNRDQYKKILEPMIPTLRNITDVNQIHKKPLNEIIQTTK